MDVLVGWIFTVLFVLQAVSVVVGWILLSALWLRCHKKKECFSENCPFREYCPKKELSQGEWSKVYQMMEECSMR